MKRPDVGDPSIIKLKKTHSHRLGGGGYRSKGGGRYMGLFDWNFVAGYIKKKANDTLYTGVTENKTNGQYFMFQLQESILSNYIWAKSYKRNKTVKFGLQNTYELGLKSGSATGDSSNYSDVKTPTSGNTNFFFNYQLGLAMVIRLGKKADIGYTYYPYVKSVFAPDVKHYSKARFRYGHLMGEYSFGGKRQYELKYLRGGRMYIGASYTQAKQDFTTNPKYYMGSSNVSTSWIQLSMGRIF
jgi:hypothetical protein